MKSNIYILIDKLSQSNKERLKKYIINLCFVEQSKIQDNPKLVSDEFHQEN